MATVEHVKYILSAPSSLGKAQERFGYMVTLLLVYAHALGYRVRIDHAKRCNDCKTGHPRSLHKSKLAIDIDLVLDGELLTDSAQYSTVGEYWESLGGAWGGRFGDGRHFSHPWGGMR